MAWYRAGTVAVTNGSTTVTGTGTQWVSASLAPGDEFKGPDGRGYEITAVVSETELTIYGGYMGSTDSGADYAVMWTESRTRDLNASLQTYYGDIQTMLSGPGAGLFAKGSAASPGVAADLDRDTGLAWLASNALSMVAGGVDALRVTATAATGGAVVSDDTLGAANIGKIMTAGKFGIGHVGAPSILADIDVSTIPAGSYRYTDSSSGTFPPNVGTFGHVRIERFSSTQMRQTLWSYGPTSPVTWVRHGADAGWSDWHRSEITASTMDDPGANGGYYRSTGGLLLCTHRLSISGFSDVVWTYPAAFSGAPAVFGQSQGTKAPVSAIVSVSATSCTVKFSNAGEGTPSGQSVSVFAIGSAS